MSVSYEFSVDHVWTYSQIFLQYTVYPPLVSLTEGMMTPLLGVVETLKPPFTTSTDGTSLHYVQTVHFSYACIHFET